MKRIVCISVLLSACGYTQPVPKGEGSWSKPAKERLESEATDAWFTRVASKAAFAAAHPADLQANRDAVEMTRQVMRHAMYSKDPTVPPAKLLVAQVDGAVRNLAALDSKCATNLEVAAMFVAADMDELAYDKYVDSMSSCGSVRALRDGAYVFESLGRCDALQPHAAAIWPVAGSDEQIDVLDAVAICSTPVNLRPNLLSFAAPSVVEDYLVLLDSRARQRAVSQCRSSCYSAYESCSYGCWGGPCGACDQTRALCEASCR